MYITRRVYMQLMHMVDNVQAEYCGSDSVMQFLPLSFAVDELKPLLIHLPEGGTQD